MLIYWSNIVIETRIMNSLNSLLMRKNSLLGEQKLPAHCQKNPCLCNAIDDKI